MIRKAKRPAETSKLLFGLHVLFRNFYLNASLSYPWHGPHFMRLAALLLALAWLLPSVVGQSSTSKRGQSTVGTGVIVYAEGGAFLLQGPNGWIADHDTGQQMGICCVFYPEGSNFDDAETVIYPNLATKGTGQASLKEFMEYDLSEFRENNPGMTYEDAEDLPLKNKRVAKLRYFRGVNKGSSEAIAYIDEQKIIALVVVSSKTEKGLNQAMPLLRNMLQSYAYMDVKFAPGTDPKPH